MLLSKWFPFCRMFCLIEGQGGSSEIEWLIRKKIADWNINGTCERKLVILQQSKTFWKWKLCFCGWLLLLKMLCSLSNLFGCSECYLICVIVNWASIPDWRLWKSILCFGLFWCIARWFCPSVSQCLLGQLKLCFSSDLPLLKQSTAIKSVSHNSKSCGSFEGKMVHMSVHLPFRCDLWLFKGRLSWFNLLPKWFCHFTRDVYPLE